MKNIGSRIKNARLAKNLKQEELAKLLGTKKPTVVSTWERGIASPSYGTLLSLCEILNVSPNYILGFSGEATSPDEMAAIKKYRALDAHGQDLVSYVLNSEYQRVHAPTRKARMLRLNYFPMAASAGVGNFLDSAVAEDIYVLDTPDAEAADFVIPVSGDSMEPTFHNGDRVLIQEQETIEVGEIGIFIINGDSYIKELGVGCLISHNSNYDDIPIGDDDSVFCCGKVSGVAETNS